MRPFPVCHALYLGWDFSNGIVRGFYCSFILWRQGPTYIQSGILDVYQINPYFPQRCFSWNHCPLTYVLPTLWCTWGKVVVAGFIGSSKVFGKLERFFKGFENEEPGDTIFLNGPTYLDPRTQQQNCPACWRDWGTEDHSESEYNAIVEKMGLQCPRGNLSGRSLSWID